MGGAAVRDNETGLVWERAPTSPILNWFVSHAHCNALKTGGRLGWRLPELHELASLIDPAVTTPPHLPPGHPFQSILTDVRGNYTSATSVAGTPGAYTTVSFFSGEVGGGGAKGGAGGNPSWCVRGGQGPDPAQD
jgi:hypothetical protein